MKNKLKYLAIIFVAICCFTIACSGDVLGASDGSSLIDNYLRALEQEDTETKRDGDAKIIINTMLAMRVDSSNYKGLNDIDDEHLGYLNTLNDKYAGLVYTDANSVAQGIKADVSRVTMENFAVWASSTNVRGYEGIAGKHKEDSWHAILYMISFMKTQGRFDFTKIINSDEHKELLKRLDLNEQNLEESRFMQLTYEYAAMIRLQAIIGNVQLSGEQQAAGIYETIEAMCKDENYGNQFVLEGVVNSYNTDYRNDGSENYEVLSCNTDDYEDSLNNLKNMADVIAEMKTRIKNVMESLVEEGNIGDDLVDASADTIANEEGMVANAANTAYREYNNYLFGFGGYTANSPEFSMGTLKNRLLGLKEAGELSSVNEFKGIIENDILGFVLRIGRYLIYAALLFYGVKCIWDGANGKAQFKEMLPYLLVALVFFYSGRGLVNVVQSIFDTYEYENFGAEAFGSIIYIVRILAFAGILFAGVKLMFASAEAKADIKAHLIPIIIGCVFVFSSSLVVDIIVTIFDESGFERSQTYIEQKIDVM